MVKMLPSLNELVRHPFFPRCLSQCFIFISDAGWNKFWNEKSILNITDYTTLFSKNDFPFDAMIDAGYSDARKNKEQLDTIFDGKQI